MIPVVTIPAIESDSTALHLGYLRVGGLAPWGWLVWIGFLAGLHALFGFTTWDLIGVCVGVSSWLGWVVWRMRFARWAQLVEPLLRAQPWRPVEATLHGSRILAGDRVFALHGMPRRVRNVIARTGRVWLVGPDERGFAAVRVEGSGRPWLARVRRRAGRPTPGRPVDHRWRLRRRLRLVASAGGVFVAAFLALVAGTVVAPPEPGELGDAIFVYALVLVPLALLLLWVRRLRAAPWPPASWYSIAGAVDDADFLEDSEPYVRGWAVLPEVGPVVVGIPDCPLDLYTDIWFHRRIWVLGAPRKGTVVIGIPGFPVTAEACFG
jgi:hypothetical protein